MPRFGDSHATAMIPLMRLRDGGSTPRRGSGNGPGTTTGRRPERRVVAHPGVERAAARAPSGDRTRTSIRRPWSSPIRAHAAVAAIRFAAPRRAGHRRRLVGGVARRDRFRDRTGGAETTTIVRTVKTPTTAGGGPARLDGEHVRACHNSPCGRRDGRRTAVVEIETSQGLGSGVIYDRKGHILTAAHVVSGVSAVTVRLADARCRRHRRRFRRGQRCPRWWRSAAERPQPAVLATGTKLEVGELAVAIEPVRARHDGDAGVVSAVARSIDNSSLRADRCRYQLGNSGGPLVEPTAR